MNASSHPESKGEGMIYSNSFKQVIDDMKIQQVHSYISIFWNIHCIREQSWHASSLYINTVRWWSSPIWINCWTWSAPFSFCAKETILIEKFDCNHGGSWSKLHHITRTLHMTRVEIQLQHENFVALDVTNIQTYIYIRGNVCIFSHKNFNKTAP